MIYQPKPIFSVGKAIIALIIIIFNFWSFDSFSRSYYAEEYECIRDINGFGIGIDTSKNIKRIYDGGSNFQAIQFKSLYKFYNYASGYDIQHACLLTDEPQEPVLHDRVFIVKDCNNPDSTQGTLSSITDGLSSSHRLITSSTGNYSYNNFNYKFTANYEWDSPLGLIPETYYACDITETVNKSVIISECNYGESSQEMTPFIVDTWASGNFVYQGVNYKYNREDDSFIYYSCDLNHDYPQDVSCFENNPSAVESFSITEKQSLPLTNGRFNFAGCAYNVQQVTNTTKDWNGNCFDFSLTRFDLVTTSSATLPVLSSCILGTGDNTGSDNEGVQQVLSNQVLLAENQLTIVQEQQKLSDNLTQVETNLVSNQNTLLNSQSDILVKQDNILSNDLLVEEKLNNLLSQSQNETAALDNINQTLKNNHSSTIDLLTESSANPSSDYFDNAAAFIGDIVSNGEIENKDNLNNSLKDLTNNNDVGVSNSPISESQAATTILQLEGFFPQAQTCDISLTNPVTNTKINFDLSWSDKLKEMLAWVMAFYTFLALVDILFTPVKAKD